MNGGAAMAAALCGVTPSQPLLSLGVAALAAAAGGVVAATLAPGQETAA